MGWTSLTPVAYERVNSIGSLVMGNRINISVSPPTCLNGLELIFRRLDLKLLHEAREGHLERGMALHTPMKVSRDVNDRLPYGNITFPRTKGRMSNLYSFPDVLQG